jgi:hypothetical protein
VPQRRGQLRKFNVATLGKRDVFYLFHVYFGLYDLNADVLQNVNKEAEKERTNGRQQQHTEVTEKLLSEKSFSLTYLQHWTNVTFAFWNNFPSCVL